MRECQNKQEGIMKRGRPRKDGLMNIKMTGIKEFGYSGKTPI